MKVRRRRRICEGLKYTAERCMSRAYQMLIVQVELGNLAQVKHAYASSLEWYSHVCYAGIMVKRARMLDSFAR